MRETTDIQVARHQYGETNNVDEQKAQFMHPLNADYFAHLRVQSDGRIWWRLIDALKLGAGFVPVRDDEQNLLPKLRAANNRIVVDERNLLSEFSQPHYSATHPRLIEREGERFVEAQEFLDWLARYLAANPDSGIAFPQELARAVRNAKIAPVSRSVGEPEFESLEIALAEWSSHLLVDLPEALRARVEREFFPMGWDDLPESQRRSLARQNDDRNDPALQSERKFWWDFYVRKAALEREIATWSEVTATTATDLAERTEKLTALGKQLAVMKRQERSDQIRVERVGQRERASPLAATAPIAYLAYPKASMALAKRLHATPDEIAAWVYMEPKLNGLAAYLNSNELDPPPRFQYSVGVGNDQDFDYIAPLMACSFDELEIAAFAGTERYITGSALLERWHSTLGIHAEAFVVAKIRQTRLNDVHPMTGFTQGTAVGDDSYPPVTAGLFSVSEIELIEALDFSTESAATLPETDTIASSLVPVTAARIKLNFAVDASDDKNEKWWSERMANAKRNGLAACRVGPARRGTIGGSLWRPDLVAGWLLGKKEKGARGMISDVGVRKGLKKFPGYEQIADDMLLSD